MAKYSIDSATLTGIADAIREKVGTTGAIATSKMAESILSIKGGLSLDVVTASSLPGTVVDGQIVVITDTTPGTVYIDTDEPASPVAGDLWIRLEAGADVALVLTEGTPYVGGGLVEAKQWNGSAWPPLYGYLGVNGAWVQFSAALPPVGTALNDMTWKQISAVAKSGLASTYFSAGDRKEIVINGTVGKTTFTNLSVWAFILGFDHNSSIEGSNTIHFQIGKSALTGGRNLCFIDSKYQTTTSEAGYFHMNVQPLSKGGWESSQMRKGILGSNTTPTAPASGSFLAALPSDLLSVMRSVTKYTDNTGGGKNTASYVTPTEDYLWLPSVCEVFGTAGQGNSAEANYQDQYAFYAAGNSKIFHGQSESSGAVSWWTRSACASSAYSFVDVVAGGSASYHQADNSYGMTPCFCV